MDILFTKEEMAPHFFMPQEGQKRPLPKEKVQLLEGNSYVYAK